MIFNKKFFLFSFILVLHVSNVFSMEECRTGYPKWDGLVELKKMGLHTPDGIFIWPYSPEAKIREVVNRFIPQCKTELIALRPDGVNGIGKTPPGISFSKTHLNDIISKLMEWSTAGYGVSLIETYNRFDYDFCCNIVLDRCDGFEIEFVGPGYDGGDLNKSILTATMAVSSRKEYPLSDYCDASTGTPNWDLLDKLYFKVDITGRIPTEKEVQTRLHYTMTKLLPDMGVNIDKTLESTRSWLIQNHCARFLERINPRACVSLEDLQTLVSSAAMYANYLRINGKSQNAKALTAHKYNGKVIFFGAYDSQKWGSYASAVKQ